MLTVTRLSKSFGGIQALIDVSMSIAKGEIYGLIGPNGAGKTTFFNLLTGIYARDSGRIEFNGAPLHAAAPDAAAVAGIARTFQNIRLFANLSALENVMIGRHARTSAGVWAAILRTAAQRAEEISIEARARELLAFTGLSAHANTRAASLPYGAQRRLEIARALATDPKLLALDEPAAGMNAEEIDQLDARIRKLKQDGLTILLIEHHMELVMAVTDRIAVLNFGQKIAEGTPDEVQTNPLVQQAYLGVAEAA